MKTPETIETGTLESTPKGLLDRTIAGFKSVAKKPTELIRHTADYIRKTTGKPVKQTVARIGLSAFAIGSMVGAGVGCDNQEKDLQEKPGITDTVDVTLSNTFSNEADEGVISSKNKTTVSLENAPKEIIEDKTNNTATLPFFPFQAPEGTEIKYRKKTFNPSIDETAESLDEPVSGGIWYQDATISRYVFSLPEGTRVYAPTDANFYLQDALSPDHGYYIRSTSLYHYDAATDTTYEIFIWGRFYPATPLTQYPKRPIKIPENWQEELSEAKQGDLLLETRGDSTSVEMGVMASKGNSLKPEDTLFKKNMRELSPEFPIIDGKIVALQQ